MARAGRGLWPFRQRRLLSPRGSRRVLSASAPAPLLGRRIGPPLVLLSPLAGMALLAPAPAQAQTHPTIWSATLTADKLDDGHGVLYFGCDNPNSIDNCSNTTVLTDDDFPYGSKTYSIVSLAVGTFDGTTQEFRLFLDDSNIAPGIKENGVLTAGANSLSFSNATITTQGTFQKVSWSSPGFTWTDNQVVELRIRAPKPGLTFSRQQLFVNEGNSANYTVKLKTKPSANVTVTMNRVAGSDDDLTLDTDTTMTGDQNTLTFTPSNWNTAQTVTVSAAQDMDNSNGTADWSHTVTSTDPVYTGLIGLSIGEALSQLPVSATELDDEGLTVAAEPGNGQVTLSWNQVPGASYYRYKVWEGSDTNGRVIRNWRWLADSRFANPRAKPKDRMLALNNSGVVSGLDNGTTYTFKIHEMRSTFIKQGSWWRWRSGLESNAVTATPAGPPPPRCTSTITGDGSVTGRWSGRYRFGDWIPECASAKRGDNYATQYYHLTLDEPSTVTLDLNSRAAGTHLYLWGGINRSSGTPLAENSGISWGGSGFSSRIERTLAAGSYTVEATTYGELDDGQFTLSVGGLGGSTPDAVSAINVTHNGTNLAVSWAAPALAASYDVTYYNHNSGVNARAVWKREGTSITITCDSQGGQNCIEQGATYSVGVRSRNASGALTSSWVNSAPVSYQSPSERAEQERIERSRPPEAVSQVNVVHNGGRLRVTWQAQARATHYDVTYWNNNTGVNARAAWNRAGTSITITRDSRSGEPPNAVNSSATYTVGVRARNANGESAWTNSAPAAPPALSVADASVSEPASGRANLNFTVTLSPTSTETVTVEYATADGTATQPGDYTSTSGTLTFSPGASTRRVSVPVLADSVNEGSETLVLRLSNATKGRITQGQATGTITNDGLIPAAWNARFGRTVADQVLEGVETRLRSAPDSRDGRTPCRRTAGMAGCFRREPTRVPAGGGPACPVAGGGQRRQR